MGTKKYYPDTDLDRKIPKKADIEAVKCERFSQLCQFYGLDEKALLADTASPWRELCWKIMNKHIRGFQISNSGSKKSTSFEEDHKIFLDVESIRTYTILHEITPEKSLDTHKRIRLNRAYQIVGKRHGLRPDQAKSSYIDAKKLDEKYHDVIYDPTYKGEIPEELAYQPDKGAKSRVNRQKRTKYH